MATETDLRDALREPDPAGRGEIDLDAVLRRTRRRRRPRVIAAGALGSVALVGVLGTAIFVAIPRADPGAMMTAEDAAGSDEAAPLADDSALGWMPDACGAPVTDPPPVAGLSLTIEPIAVPLGAVQIPVTLTLRNDGSSPLIGSSARTPHLTLSRDGVVVWHSPGGVAEPTVGLALAPGESTTYVTVLEPAVCGSEDDLQLGGSVELPAAPPGDYEVRAALEVDPDGDASPPLLVTGPPVPVRVH